MRLLNVNTLAIEEVVGSPLEHNYAILSHTWLHGQEVSLREWDTAIAGVSSKCDEIKRSRGWAKIEAACLETRRWGLEYLWVDTICIDRTNSTEVSETINCTYAWYQHSAICFVHLADVVGDDLDDEDCLDDFRDSRWFTRGFTLQELVAPIEVIFFSQDWQVLGTKDELLQTLADITGVRAEVLTHEEHLSSVCIAEKMSWLAHRDTTRIEDMAYCMLGLLEINMPLRYGEGEQAFLRLQQNIIDSRDDQTILCWTLPTASVPARDDIILAPDPSCFLSCGTVMEPPKRQRREPSCAMTSAGLHIQVPLIRGFANFFAVLDAMDGSVWERDNARGEGLRICLPLEGSFSDGIFQRSEYPRQPPLLPSSWAAVRSTDICIPLSQRRELLSRYAPLDDEVHSRYALFLLFDTAEDDLSQCVQSLELPWLKRRITAATFDPLRSVLELVPVPLTDDDDLPAGTSVYGALMQLTNPDSGNRRILFLGVRSEPRKGGYLRLCWIQHVSDPQPGRDFTADEVARFWEEKCRASLPSNRRLESSNVLPHGGWVEFGPVSLTTTTGTEREDGEEHIGHLKPVLIKLSRGEAADLVRVTHTVTRIPAPALKLGDQYEWPRTPGADY